ncbi:hypothetical protein H70357_18375 [Paenibacillus sp. FSL H7-0357]|uniref:DUF4097 family beta strand repeat-containing protein n=1 Tax=unclassified Paenibacillus TaxID=185978 RepID=UPI0004F90946|nr:DUF4097 family beta strand repeat-containing protein [Paenibacillus sp. FSL H7-0357]AIQ18442.1 hypothetical protein H70357_18375 [Paenibacillus sp. FSL H7-0357]
MTKYKGKKWFVLIAAAFVILVLAGCGDKAVEKTASFEGSKVQQIEVKTEGQSIKVSRSKDSEVKLRMKTSGELPAGLEAGVLTVNTEPASGFIHLKNETLYLELPEQSYESIRLATASGNITFEGQAQTISLNADSGNITVNGFTGEVDASTQSGKINLGVEASTEIQTDGGGQSLKGTVGTANTEASTLSVHSASGNINLEE